MTARKELWRDIAVTVVATLVLLAVPLATSSRGVTDFLVYAYAYGLLAMSLNLLVGYTGLVSFGHAMNFATGAYSFGLMMQSGRFSIPVAFVLALLCSAAIALAVGAICVRLKEIYFAFLTLAFQMFIYSLILSFVSITGGDQGLIGGLPRPKFLGIDLTDNVHLYVVSTLLFAACMYVMRQVVTSPFGYGMRMVRDNAERAVFLGINVVRTKLICYVISSTITSVGGIILALFVSGAYPNFGFWTTSGEAIFMILLGGISLFLGPLVGAILLTLLNNIVTVYTEHYGLVLGIIILVMVLVLRKGLLEYIMEFVRRFRSLPQGG